MPPSEEQRLQLFRLYLDPVPHAVSEEELAGLSQLANGATGADIHDWINQAASEVLTEADGAAEPVIRLRHLQTVVARRGFIAADRPSREPTYESALHEAGHAVVCWTIFGPDALAKVALGFERRGSAFEFGMLGHFEMSVDWLERHAPTSTTWHQHVAVHLAGAAAELAFLGYRGAGAETDVSNATDVILAQLDAGDLAFGPSRRTMEANTGGLSRGPVGAEAMRRLVWRLVQQRYEDCWELSLSFVRAQHRPIKRLARVLLGSNRPLAGDEIVELVQRGGSGG